MFIVQWMSFCTACLMQNKYFGAVYPTLYEPFSRVYRTSSYCFRDPLNQ